MSILVNKNSNIIIQGAAGVEGQFHMKKMIEYGTNIIAGIDPFFKVNNINGVPAYTSINKVLKDLNKIDVSIVFVPAPFAYEAVSEAISYNIKLIIIVTEGLPTNDMIKIKQAIRGKDIKIVGPNCPGIITPGEAKAGIMPGHIHKKGNIGVISRSGTLTYEVVQSLTNSGFGQSTCVGIGGDPIQGSTFVDILRLFKDDNDTKAVIMIGEIGGSEEEKAALYIKEEFDKPVISFIAGKTAPPEKRMGHAGAIISAGKGSAADKITALKNAGIKVANIPDEIVELLKESIDSIKNK